MPKLRRRDTKGSNLPPRVWLAGVPVDPLSTSEICRLLLRSVESGPQLVLGNLNMHGLYCSLRSAAMLTLLKSRQTLVHIDGMPIIWLASLAGAKIDKAARNTHIDLIPHLLRLCAERNWKVALVGSTVRGAASNRSALETLVAGLDITCFEGHFDARREAEIIKTIEKMRPALLLVGMGMPRQEEWISKNLRRLTAAMVMPVGGFADYFTGRAPMPPRFLGRMGLEWAFRLAGNPRRLAFRYLIEPILLLVLLLRATLRGGTWGVKVSQKMAGEGAPADKE